MIYVCVLLAVAICLLIRAGGRLYAGGALAIATVLVLMDVDNVWLTVLLWVMLSLVVLELLLAFRNWLGFETTVAEINPLIEAIIQRGYHNARLRFIDVASGRFIDCVKKIPFTAPTSFFMRLDSRCCSAEEFAAAQELLREEKIREAMLCHSRNGFLADFDAGRHKLPNPRYLIVACDRKLDVAIRAARVIFTKVFGLSYDSKIHVSRIGAIDPRKNAEVGFWYNDPKRPRRRKKKPPTKD